MGKAEDWQKEVESMLEFEDVVILNPRRDDWNPNWEQSKDHSHFRGQVEWELSALESCTDIFMYLQPGTNSPISLLEFGLYARSGKLIVCCPEGFHRKGNIDVTSEFYDVKQIESLKDLYSALL
jgi:hypothetical protein